MGGGGGKGGSSSTTVSIPPEVIARYNAVNARAEETAKQPFTEYSTDPNAFVAPLNSTQLAGVAGANKYAEAAQPYYTEAADYTRQGAAAVDPTKLDQNAIDQYMSPYLNNVVGSTFANLRQQQQQEQSNLAGRSAMAGAFGGDRAGLAAASLAKQQEMATGQTISGLLNQGYGQALQTAQQQQGLDLAARQANMSRLTGAGAQMAAVGTGAQGAGLAGAQAQLAAGQVGQQTEQAGKSALYNQFLQKQGYPFQVTQFLANIAEGTGALSGSTTNTVQGSDRRIKHDIKEIGETFDGEPLYAFKYKGDETTHYGPMAQNVEKRHPENVGEANGYKTVDYDAVADRAAERGHEQHAAHGGMIHSEGGVVLPFRAREGFATQGGVSPGNPGVAAGFDPDFIQQLLKERQGQYSSLYGQPGTPFGAQGAPGGKGVVPAPMGVAKPLTPASPPPRQPSTLQGAMETGKTLASFYGAGKELKKDYNDWQKGREEKAAAEKAAAEKAAAAKPEGTGGGEGRVSANDGDARTVAYEDSGRAMPAGSDAPAWNSQGQVYSGPLVEKASAVADQLPDDPNPQLENNSDLFQTAELDPSEAVDPSEFFDLARGGVAGHRKGYKGQGFVTPGYDPDVKPGDIMDQTLDQQAEDAKDDASEFNSMKPKSSGSGGGGDNTLGTVASIAGTAAKIIPFFLADGGVAGGHRQHFRLGGGDAEGLGGNRLLDVPVDPDQPQQDAPREERGLGRLQMAQAPSTTANDAGGVSPPAPTPPAPTPPANVPERPAPEPEKAKPVAPTKSKPRLPQDEMSAPFLAAANKIAPDLPGFLKSENFWIPAIATIASGMASRAPTKGQGLGEALLGGVGAYTGLRSQNAQIAESEARTEKTFADIVRDNTYEVGGRMYFRYLKPDGTWGSMSQVDYLRLPPEERSKIQFDPRIGDAMPQIIEGGKKEPAAAGAETTQGGAPPAGGVQTRPRPIEGNPAAAAAPAIAPDPNDLALSRRDHEAIVAGGRERAGQEPDFYTPQKELADAAQNVRPVLGQLAGSLSSLPPDKSILASGKAQEVLNPVAQYMDGLLRVMGLPTGINPEDLANTLATMKAVAQFQDRAASDAGRRAYASFAALANTLPSTLNTPRAQGKLLSSIYQANQIELDKQQFFDQVRQHADQYDPQTALKTGRSANEAFNKKFNAEFYAKEKKNIEGMFGTVIQGMKDPRTGRDMTVMQVLTTNPGMLSKEDKQDIVKQFGNDPKILRYFGVAYP
jgi:Chaperone of endosialidase